MKTESIKIDSYTVNIAYDQFAENPLESWDCEPPVLVYTYDRSPVFREYNDAPNNWQDILSLLPASMFERGQRVPFIRRFLSNSPADFTRSYLADFGNIKDALAACLEDEMGSKPYGWSDAREWLEHAAAILEYGGITCHFAESLGPCQGDSAFLLAIATPAWVEKVGAPADSVPDQLESACELHGQWQWGDVYGVESIADENGEEIPHGSCWGFYGSDHEKSGLLDHARNAIECHERHNEKQAAHFTAALCSAE